MSAASKRVPVPVDAETYARLQAYSEATGASITHGVNEALNAWLDTVGAHRLEIFKQTKHLLHKREARKEDALLGPSAK